MRRKSRDRRIDLNDAELSNIKTVADYLFMGNYQANASYPRFEECFGAFLVDKEINLPNVYKLMCGKRKKYITFRRLIISYEAWKNNSPKLNEDFINFMDLLYNNILKNPETTIGEKISGAHIYNTKNSENRNSISQFCVITDETQKIIKGFQLIYDDFFTNNLFLNNEKEKFYIGLELNLRSDDVLDQEGQESFPTKNDRDGITHLGGTIDNDTKTINFLVFKCRSGKISFIGKPKGEPFLIGNFGQQLHTIRIALNDDKLIYLQPGFIDIERQNPNVNKNSDEITQNFIEDDKPIYEETLLENVSNEKEEENDKAILNPLMSDNRFYDSQKYDDKIYGTRYNEICPIVDRFITINPYEGGCDINIDLISILGEATNYLAQRDERINKIRNGIGFLKPVAGILSNLTGFFPTGPQAQNIKPGDFLQNPANFNSLLQKVGNIITRDASKDPNINIDISNLSNVGGLISGAKGIISGVSNILKKNKTLPTVNNNNNDGGDKLRGAAKSDKLKGGLGDVFNVVGEISEGLFGFSPFGGGGRGRSHSVKNTISSFFNPFGFSSQNYEDDYNNDYYDNYGYYNNNRQYYVDDSYQRQLEEQRKQQLELIRKQEEERKKKLSEELLRQKMLQAQNNWKNFYSKYSQNQGIFLIQTIGAVIKGLTLLRNEENGVPNNYSLEEKVRLFNILKNNREIIGMLAKAHKEYQRRQMEIEKIKIAEKELEKMRIEEEKRKEEERIKIEEERRRKEEEKRIEEEQKKIEEERKKREEEQRILEQKIQEENDRRRREELQRQEEQKRREEEKKRQEEERKKRELEEQKRLLELEKQKIIEEQRRKEQERQKYIEELNKKKQEEERKKYEAEEAAKKEMQEKVTLNADELPKIMQKLEFIKQAIQKGNLSSTELMKLTEYYNSLLRDKNAIIEELNKQEAKKLAEQMNFDPEEAKKKELIEREKLKKEEDEKIAKKKLEEEEKQKQKTKIISISNLEIPEGTKTWRNQQMAKKNAIFTDPLFEPLKKNLCPVNEYGKWNPPEDITSDDLSGWEKISWDRAENIFGSKNYQVFYEGIKSDDIIQGGLGDCYFLSAIAALCKFPKMIERLFLIREKSNEHCYGCYFRVNGIWKLVLVDDYIPCYGSWGKNFAFSRTNGNELWAILIEKAWAKLNGNYAKSIGGEPQEVFEVTTNAYSEKIRVKKSEEDNIWTKFLKAGKRNCNDNIDDYGGFLMTAGTSGDSYSLPIEEMGLVPGHAYTVLEVKEITNARNEKVKLINLRNPWGNGEWSGDWSDSSSKWTNDIRNQCGGVYKKDDGSFWMSYSEFLKYFVIVGICHLCPNYYYTTLHVPKNVTKNGPVISRIEVRENSTHAYIMLHQKNPRIILKSGDYQKSVICYIYLVDDKNNYIKANGKCDKNVCIEVNLNEGNYYLISDINFRYVQNVQHCYNLSAYASSPVGIFTENNKNIEEAFKYGLYSYSKNNLSPKEHNGGYLYQSKQNGSEFPFNFCLFDNEKGSYDIKLTDTLNFKASRNADYYFEGSNNKSASIVKNIMPGQWDIFCHMPYSPGSLYSYGLKSSGSYHSGPAAKKGCASLSDTVNQNNQNNNYNQNNYNNNNYSNNNANTNKVDLSSNEIMQKVFGQDGEILDNRGYLKQYVYSTRNGHYIGFENNSSRSLKMKLILSGLYEVNNPNSSPVYFTSNAGSRKVFLLKPKPDSGGDISFMFDTA